MKLSGIILFFLASTAFSQKSIDLMTLSYRYGQPQPYTNSSGLATENVFFGNFKIPLVLNKSTIWYSDLTYQYFNVSNSEDIQSTLMPIGLHGIILQTGLVKQINDRNSIQLLLAPRLMSDFSNLSPKHFQLGGIGLYEVKYQDRLTMRYGLMYNKERFGNMFVPLVYVDWSITPKWSITGLLPIFAKFNYHATEKLTFGFSHFGLITSFQVGDPTYNNDYIERKSIDLSFFGRYKFWNNLCVEGRVGFAVGRSYLQFAQGDEVDFRVAILSFGDNRIQKNEAFNPGPIFDIRIAYNLPLPDSN